MQLAPNERDNGARRKVKKAQQRSAEKGENFRDTSRTAGLKTDSLDSRVTDTPDRDCTADQNLQAVPTPKPPLPEARLIPTMASMITSGTAVLIAVPCCCC